MNVCKTRENILPRWVGIRRDVGGGGVGVPRAAHGVGGAGADGSVKLVAADDAGLDLGPEEC